MKKIFILIVALFVMVVGVKYFSKSGTPVVTAPSITGCYVANLAQDVYTLNIQNENGSTIAGTLAFKNFEKDSSSGILNGSYSNGILLGDYTFNSEGMSSVRQVIFKKDGDNFVEGFGDVLSVGDKETFKDTNAITYDPNSTFKPSASCK